VQKLTAKGGHKLLKMSFLTEIECSRESLVGNIVLSIPEALKGRDVKPNESKYSAAKHFLPTQSPSPLDARENDFYVYKRMSRMLDTEFPKKIGCDPIDPLEGFWAAPKVAVASVSRSVPTLSPNTTRAKKMLQDARAWDFKYSEALEQSQFLKNREVKLQRSGRRTEIPVALSEATSRSEIISNLKVLSQMHIQSSEESDDTEYCESLALGSVNSPEKGASSRFLKSCKSLNRTSLSFGRFSQATSTLSAELFDDDKILLSDKEKKRYIISMEKESRSVMQTDASDPDSDESDVELAGMKQILESAKFRPFSDSRRSAHDEINPYGNSDFLNGVLLCPCVTLIVFIMTVLQNIKMSFKDRYQGCRKENTYRQIKKQSTCM
jgi:hypothetical protein